MKKNNDEIAQREGIQINIQDGQMIQDVVVNSSKRGKLIHDKPIRQ